MVIDPIASMPMNLKPRISNGYNKLFICDMSKRQSKTTREASNAKAPLVKPQIDSVPEILQDRPRRKNHEAQKARYDAHES